jgi:RNA polymerase sigma factor for flagellar operon FliA
VPDDATIVINELWAREKSGSAPGVHERLILHASPLVKVVAGRVAAGLPQNIEQTDLASHGIFELIDAIDTFNPWPRFRRVARRELE